MMKKQNEENQFEIIIKLQSEIIRDEASDG